MVDDPNFEVRPLSDDEAKARKRRNLWLALALVGFVILVGVITVVRLSQGINMSPDGGF